MLTRDGLQKRCFVAACLDLVDPRDPRPAHDTHASHAAASSREEEPGGWRRSTALAASYADPPAARALVGRTAALVRAPLTQRGLHGHGRAGDAATVTEAARAAEAAEAAEAAAAGAAAAAAAAAASASSAAAGAFAEPAADWVDAADALPFVADPLLACLAAQRHLLPRTGRLAPNQHLLLRPAAATGDAAAATNGGSGAATATTRYSLAALEVDEASLLAALLPLPKPTFGNAGGEDGADEGGLRFRRRAPTLSPGEAQAAARAAAAAFAPAVPPSRSVLAPPRNLAPNSQNGSRSGSSGHDSSGHGSSSKKEQHAGGAGLYKSRLFLASVLGATAADAPGRLTYLDGGGGANAGTL